MLHATLDLAMKKIPTPELMMERRKKNLVNFSLMFDTDLHTANQEEIKFIFLSKYFLNIKSE